METQLILSHGLPINAKSITKELTCLYDWSILIIEGNNQHSRTFFKLLLVSLERVYKIIYESKPTIVTEMHYYLTSLIGSITKKPNWLVTNNLCSIYVYLCGNVCYLLQLENEKINQVDQLTQILRSSCLCGNDSCLLSKPNNGTFYYAILANSHGFLSRYTKALELLSQLGQAEDLIITHLKGRLMFHDGRYEQAATHLINAIKTGKWLSNKQRSSIFNTIGSCLANANKPSLSCHWFHKSFQDDSENTLALWNLALQYRSLENVDAEIGTLQLLVDASKAARLESSHSFISDTEALYLFGYRCIHLKFYDQAAKCYKDILKHLNEETAVLKDWKVLNCPCIVQIKLEAAYIFHQASRITESIDTCDSINNDFPETRMESKPGLLRANLNGTSNYFSYSNSGLQGISASFIKAMSLLKLGLVEDASEIFKKLQCSMTLLCGHSEENYNTSPLAKKRMKLEKKNEFDENSQEELNLQSLFELISLVYCNLAVLRIQQDLLTDALHLLRVSLACWSDNVDSVFNYILLLMKLNEKGKAIKSWLEAKVNIASLQKALDLPDSPNCFTVSAYDLKRLDACLC